jgi:hypothetical protein
MRARPGTSPGGEPRHRLTAGSHPARPETDRARTGFFPFVRSAVRPLRVKAARRRVETGVRIACGGRGPYIRPPHTVSNPRSRPDPDRPRSANGSAVLVFSSLLPPVFAGLLIASAVPAPLELPSSAVASHPIVRMASAVPVGSDDASLDPDGRLDASASALTAVAMLEIGHHVRLTSHPESIQRAFHAYYAYRARHPEKVRKPYLYFVDYGLDNRTPRGWVFDMDEMTVVEGPFMVAHGRGSGPEGVPTRFTNIRDSATSSLGLFLAEETYAFSGRSGGRRYSSIGLRMRGLSGSFNDAARARGIVAHGAPYVTADRAGRSEGCPAMEEFRAQRLLPRIANGGMVYLFSPVDQRWMAGDPWLADGVGAVSAR